MYWWSVPARLGPLWPPGYPKALCKSVVLLEAGPDHADVVAPCQTMCADSRGSAVRRTRLRWLAMPAVLAQCT